MEAFCDKCEEFVKRIHSLQDDRLHLCKRIKELEDLLATTEAAYRREKERADRIAEELAWHHNKLTFTYE